MEMIAADTNVVIRFLVDEGFDFADALHSIRSAGLELKTFDRKFLNKGQKYHLKISPP